MVSTESRECKETVARRRTALLPVATASPLPMLATGPASPAIDIQSAIHKAVDANSSAQPTGRSGVALGAHDRWRPGYRRIDTRALRNVGLSRTRRFIIA
jgi:hypothetical protein